MLKNYFICYESEIDADLLSKYFGNNLSPGIYALPEDSLNNDEQDEIDNSDENKRNYTDPDNDNLNAFQKKAIEQQQLSNSIQRLQDPDFDPIASLSQDELQKFNYEVAPLKKIYLFNKLISLNTKLKNNFQMNTDLDILIKFGPSLSYETMLTLALSILNSLKATAQDNQNQSNIQINQNDLSGENTSNEK